MGPQLHRDNSGGLCGAPLRQEKELAPVASEDPRVSRQCQGSQSAGIKNEFRSCLAIAAGIRNQFVRGEVPWREERRIAWSKLQQDYEDDTSGRKSFEDMEIFHYEGLECQLGDKTHDDPV